MATAVLVVCLTTAAHVPNVGPWHLFLGGTEQKYCVCSNLSEGLTSVLPNLQLDQGRTL